MLNALLHPIAHGLDRAKFAIKKRLDLFDPIFIYPYRSYGFGGRAWVRGRVLERERVVHGDEQKDSTLSNLHRFYKRYESDEIPGVEVEIEYQGKRYTTTTDPEGYYELEIDAEDRAQSGVLWDQYDIRILSAPFELGEADATTATGEIMLVGRGSGLGVISDVDDTIIESHAAKLWLQIKTLALKHVDSRVAFPGVSALYRALVGGAEGQKCRPLWFVSGSSWNLYDLIDGFCRNKGIPKAPLLLRELGIHADAFIKKKTMVYKLEHIRPLMAQTDPLRFILIGDSGQKDPEIYRKVVEEHPGRVAAIYIRDVTSPKREREVEEIADDLRQHGVEMLLAKDSHQAAEHAHARGWISDDDLRNVKSEVDRDGGER